MSFITSVEQLEAVYGQANDASTVKVADRVTPLYRQLIAASPFAALAPRDRKGSIARRGAIGPGSSASTMTGR